MGGHSFCAKWYVQWRLHFISLSCHNWSQHLLRHDSCSTAHHSSQDMCPYFVSKGKHRLTRIPSMRIFSKLLQNRLKVLTCYAIRPSFTAGCCDCFAATHRLIATAITTSSSSFASQTDDDSQNGHDVVNL